MSPPTFDVESPPPSIDGGGDDAPLADAPADVTDGGEADAPAESGPSGDDGGAVFWRSDFEDGTLGVPDVWYTNPKGTHPDCMVVTATGPAAHGSHALDVHVHPDDTPAPDDLQLHKSRDELSQGGSGDVTDGFKRIHGLPGQTTYYRVAYYFPDDLNPNQHGFNIITQFHGAGGGTSPVVDLSIDATNAPYTLRVATHGGAKASPTTRQFPIGDLPASAGWVEIVYGVGWAADATGSIEAWRRDGLSGAWNQVVPRTATPTLYFDDPPVGAILKIGWYRGPDGPLGSATGPWPEVSHLVFDDVMAGDSLTAVQMQ
jgi:hypothetical protein